MVVNRPPLLGMRNGWSPNSICHQWLPSVVSHWLSSAFESAVLMSMLLLVGCCHWLPLFDWRRYVTAAGLRCHFATIRYRCCLNTTIPLVTSQTQHTPPPKNHVMERLHYLASTCLVGTSRHIVRNKQPVAARMSPSIAGWFFHSPLNVTAAGWTEGHTATTYRKATVDATPYCTENTTVTMKSWSAQY